MINIRYHIVSITAVFLALGIGVALGSTFLDRATVGRLDDNIRNAEAEIDATNAENTRLTDQIAAFDSRDAALLAASGTIFDGRLDDRPVLLVAAPGVDQGTLDDVRLVVDNADADLRGTVTLRDRLFFTGEEVDEGLAEALGLTGTSTEEAREVVYAQVVEALAAAGAPAEPEPDEEDPTTTTTSTTSTVPDTGPDGSTTVPESTTTTSTTTTLPPDASTTEPVDEAPEEDEVDTAPAPDGTEPEIITILRENDLIGFDPGPASTPDDPILEQTGYRYVFVSQPDLPPEADQLLLNLLPGFATSPAIPAVVVSPSQEVTGEEGDEPNPTAVDAVRDDSDRAALYDTVDDIDTFLGLSSVVAILAADEGTAAGHYGQGDGATALTPAGP